MGFVVFETQCLLFSKTVKLDKKRGERVVRLMFVVLTCVTMAVWIFSTSVALNGEILGLCCSDVWQIPTQQDINLAQQSEHPAIAIRAMEAMESRTPMLLNTANETVLAFTMAGYWGEAWSGIWMICGLLAIWWYCPERNIDLSESFLDNYPLK